MYELNSAVHPFLPNMGLVRAATFTLAFVGMAHGFTLNMVINPGDAAMSRREAVSAIAASTTFTGDIIRVRNYQYVVAMNASWMSGSLVNAVAVRQSKPICSDLHIHQCAVENESPHAACTTRTENGLPFTMQTNNYDRRGCHTW